VKFIAVFLLVGTGMVRSQPASPKAVDPWSAIGFLEGTWEAKTLGGAANANVAGSYSFKKELGGHILARHSSRDGCKGPAGFDCDHGDLLYVFQDQAGEPLKAIYFDNEGHIIHYSVSTPAPDRVVFISDAGTPGPRFQLVYELKAGVMSGKFEMQMPGKTDWMPYLEWSGKKQ
jgi:hypothetical protein